MQSFRVEIVSLSQLGPAFAAGLREGDVIIEVNRRAIANLEAFNEMISSHSADSSNNIIALTVVRDERRILMFL